MGTILTAQAEAEGSETARELSLGFLASDVFVCACRDTSLGWPEKDS